MKKTLFSCLFLFLIVESFAQKQYSEVNFRSPVGIPLLLSGNFAELRSNHFHTVLDIKTKGVSGYRIYAIDSGYVSRINVSHWGYGKALYVDHPNGYTSVYGHLSKFSSKIEDYLRQQQYKQQSELVTLYLDSTQIPISKSEVVALSGNSGSSSGPHLHFEVRETVSEKPVNPLLFNFKVEDDIPPSIYNIKVYPLDSGVVNNSQKNQLIPVSTSSGKYSVKQKIVAFGEIGLGIHTIDKLNGSGNICGIYTIELYVDDQLYFFQQMEKLDFSTNRYINTHKDYLEYKKNRRSIHKSFISENNELDIYAKVKNNGKLTISSTKKYAVKYIVTDVNGNQSELNFTIYGDSAQQHFFKSPSFENQLNAVKFRDSIVRSDIRVVMPEKSMYQSEKVSLVKDTYTNSKSAYYSIMNENIPVHKKFVLSLKLKDTSAINISKAVLVSVSGDKKKVVARGGKYANGWLEANVKKFGGYTVLIDSTAPKIKLINVFENKNIKGLSYLQFKITDDLSGIKKYNAFIDDKWVLSNYIPRSAALKIWAKEWKYLTAGKHTLKLVIEDERGNVAIKSIHINY